ncbi:MAG: hypothetical protein HYV09_10500 [Deltaproteobacteria bacterium]|nr:hypothetical protein [Deltaproteobacteria bacterium]
MDTPAWMRGSARAISLGCIATLVAVGVLLVFDPFESPWTSLGLQYLSSAALGLDAIAHGVRKRSCVGPSIVNLAPGGWAVFASMFWIVAVPAYFIGARRRVHDGEPREPLTWGSWAIVGGFVLFGAALACAPLVR